MKECEDSLNTYIADEESPVFNYSDNDIDQILIQENQNFAQTQESFGTFKLANATRWYSTLEMLKTYHKNFGIYSTLT